MKREECFYVARGGMHGYVRDFVTGDLLSNCIDCGYNPDAPVQWLDRLWRRITR